VKAADRLKINLLYAGNFALITPSPAPLTLIVVYTYKLIRFEFNFSSADWAAYILSIAYIGFVFWFLGWSDRARRQIRARDVDTAPQSDVTGIRRRK